MYPVAAAVVAYNVPVDRSLDGASLEMVRVEHVLHSPGIGPLNTREVDSVRKNAYSSVSRFLRESGLALLTSLKERHWSLDSMGDPTGDRTIPIVFADPRVVTDSLITFLQHDVLSKFPAWRICHWEDSELCELNIAVYPDAFSIGWKFIERPIASALADWVAQVEAHREKSAGPFRKQLVILEQILKNNTIPAWKSQQPLIIGAFSYFTDGPQQSLWVLVGGDSPYSVAIDAESMEEGNYYPLKKTCELGELLATKSSTQLWLREISFPGHANERQIAISPKNGNLHVVCIREFKEL